jgi:hypothetical protein
MSSLLVIFVWGWCSNFVGSEAGQKQSVKLLQNMVYNTTQHPPPLPLPHSRTLSVYTLPYIYRGKGGGGGQREGIEEQQFTSWVENTNHE